MKFTENHPNSLKFVENLMKTIKIDGNLKEIYRKSSKFQ